jgi:hypothetical protein
MATINDLLYNYQESNEFVCSDGRMSVNGICAVDQQDSVETFDTTQNIIDVSNKTGDNADDRLKQKERENKYRTDKILDDLAQDGTPDYFPDLGKEKKSFSWDMDKPSKVKDFKNTISDNINAYNGFIEENLGIPSGVQNAIRVGAATYGAVTGGGLLPVIGPFALPFIAGGAISKAEKDRIEKLTDQDRQGDNKDPIDMMTYDIPTYGEEGFNIHNDAGDNNNNNNSGHNAPGAGKGEGGGYASDFGFI